MKCVGHNIALNLMCPKNNKSYKLEIVKWKKEKCCPSKEVDSNPLIIYSTPLVIYNFQCWIPELEVWTVHWNNLTSSEINGWQFPRFWATPISQPLSHCHVGLTTSMDPSDYPHWWYPKAYFKNMLPWNPKRSMREGTILHPNPKSFITYIKAKKKGNIIEVGNIHEILKNQKIKM